LAVFRRTTARPRAFSSSPQNRETQTRKSISGSSTRTAAAACPITGDAGGTNVLIEEGFELVMRRHFVALATFLVETADVVAQLMERPARDFITAGRSDQRLLAKAFGF
jgi:hypothetical protein